MKKMILIVCFLAMTACTTGTTTQQKIDTGFNVAQQVYSVASVYYEVNKAQMSNEDQAKFAQYLAGFKLAIETGQDLSGFAMRWYQFLTEA